MTTNNECRKAKTESIGFIAALIAFLINLMHYFNLVEYFKWIAVVMSKKVKGASSQKWRSNAIDTFIIIKWCLITIFWLSHKYNSITTIITAYLLLMNIHTYFYYHVWSEDALTGEGFGLARIRRRFITLMQAYLFSLLCFAYLYSEGLYNQVDWHISGPKYLLSIILSVSTSLTGGCPICEAKCINSAFVMVLQLINSFLFVAVILSRAFPGVATSTKEK